MRAILHEPSYGFERDGRLVVPTAREILREAFSRVNVLADRRNWLSLWSPLSTLALLPFAWVFFTSRFDWRYLAAGIFYNFFLNIHGTAYLHRFGAHRAFTVRSRLALFVLRNLSIKIVGEEIFAISHHVHHAIPERPGDPYNARAGWLYCFLADVNHQTIRRDLPRPEYERVAGLLTHTGLRANTYEEYLRWGSVTHPVRLFLSTLGNWAFWFLAFSWVGGPGLACAIFGLSMLWAISLRNFNYKSHGRGRGPGAVNLRLAGFGAGEWHANHHLHPRSARAGFGPKQPDVSFQFIRAMKAVGIVESYIETGRRM